MRLDLEDQLGSAPPSDRIDRWVFRGAPLGSRDPQRGQGWRTWLALDRWRAGSAGKFLQTRGRGRQFSGHALRGREFTSGSCRVVDCGDGARELLHDRAQPAVAVGARRKDQLTFRSSTWVGPACGADVLSKSSWGKPICQSHRGNRR